MLRLLRAPPRVLLRASARFLCLLAAATVARPLLGDRLHLLSPSLKLLEELQQQQQQQRQQQPELEPSSASPTDLTPLPRVIHVTAHNELLRVEYRPVLRQWLRSQPELQLRLWRDEDAECLLRRRYPQLLAGYRDRLQTPLERSDVIRILALHSMGGMYLDLDTEPVRNVSHLFSQPLAGAMLALEPEEHAVLLYNRPSLLSNAVMLSAPGHPFLLFYANRIFANLHRRSARSRRRRNNYAAPQITGPLVMQEAYEAYQMAQDGLCAGDRQPRRCRVHLFEPQVFSPRYDLSQRAAFRTACLRWRRRRATIKQRLASNSMSDRKTLLCQRLVERSFSAGEPTNVTLAVHQFRHLTTSGSAVGRSRRPAGLNRPRARTEAAPQPALFNASAEFPGLRMLAKELGPLCESPAVTAIDSA